MRLIMTLTVLLCMCLTYGQLHAQENLDLKGTSCVPVMLLRWVSLLTGTALIIRGLKQ